MISDLDDSAPRPAPAPETATALHEQLVSMDPVDPRRSAVLDRYEQALVRETTPGTTGTPGAPAPSMTVLEARIEAARRLADDQTKVAAVREGALTELLGLYDQQARLLGAPTPPAPESTTPEAIAHRFGDNVPQDVGSYLLRLDGTSASPGLVDNLVAKLRALSLEPVDDAETLTATLAGVDLDARDHASSIIAEWLEHDPPPPAVRKQLDALFARASRQGEWHRHLAEASTLANTAAPDAVLARVVAARRAEQEEEDNDAAA